MKDDILNGLKKKGTKFDNLGVKTGGKSVNDGAVRKSVGENKSITSGRTKC